MGGARNKLNTFFSSDMVRIICVFIVVVVVPIVILHQVAPEEVDNRPSHPALIEDLVYAAKIQQQLGEMGFDFYIMQEFDAMQVEVTFDSGVLWIVTASILLYDEIRDSKILIISGARYYTSINNVRISKEIIGVPHFIKGVFERVHEIDLIAVLYNFGIAAWDEYEQKIQMAYVNESHARQFEYLLEQLQVSP